MEMGKTISIEKIDLLEENLIELQRCFLTFKLSLEHLETKCNIEVNDESSICLGVIDDCCDGFRQHIDSLAFLYLHDIMPTVTERI